MSSINPAFVNKESINSPREHVEDIGKLGRAGEH